MIEEISNINEIENLYKEGTNAPYSKIGNGFGYYGVFIKDKNSGKVQCHVCGKFFNSVSVHSYAKHKILSNDYKKKYGFHKTFPLVSAQTSNLYRLAREKKMKIEKYVSVLGFKKINCRPLNLKYAISPSF